MSDNLDSELYTALHRLEHDKLRLKQVIDNLSLMVGQLASQDRQHALHELHFISDSNSNEIIRLNSLTNRFDKYVRQVKIDQQEFNYKLKYCSTVQVAGDVYQTAFSNMQVIKLIGSSLPEQINIPEPKACFNRRLDYHTACAYRDRSIYFIGGTGDHGYIQNSVIRYDIASNSFRTAPSLKAKRTNASSCELNGWIYAVCGTTEGNQELETVERLDVASNAQQW